MVVSNEPGEGDSVSSSKRFPDRDIAFDLAKGVGIVAVVALHLTSRSASLFHKPFDAAWWSLRWINFFVNFCVPLFLLVSAILLARSLSSTRDGITAARWKRFAWRRTRSVVFPLVIWSAIYWMLRAFVQHQTSLLKPTYWADIKDRGLELVFGKAEFHLYFLSVLAQFCIVLPLVVALLRRVRSPKQYSGTPAPAFFIVLVIAIALQAGAFALQKVVRFPWPGSTVFWYLSTLIPGVWVGMNWDDWPAIRRRTWPVWIAFAAVGFAIFGYNSSLDLQHQQTNGTVTNSASAAYALGMPFMILALLSMLSDAPRGWVGATRAVLRRMGELSIQIYLMHPILLQWLGTSWRLTLFRSLPLPGLWLFSLTLFGTYGIALLLDRLPHVNQLLFGKAWERR